MKQTDVYNPNPKNQLIRRLMDLADIDASQAQSILAEVMDAYGQNVDQYIEQRHAELQRQGYRGDEIYTLIQEELTTWRFTSPPLSIRQIRRRIYG